MRSRFGFNHRRQIEFLVDGCLRLQLQFDLETFTRATDRELSAGEREKFTEIQRQANRWTHLGSGMTHPNFLATRQSLSPEAAERVEQIAPCFADTKRVAGDGYSRRGWESRFRVT